MRIKLAILMDPIESIHIEKDTTFAIGLAAQAAGWELFYFTQENLYVQQAKAFATIRSLKLKDDPKSWFELGEPQDQPLANFDVVLMRKDPPFNLRYIYTTYMLELAEQAGVLIVNKPQSLRDANEKCFTTQFPQCCPPTLITQNADQIRAFYREHQDIILKPLEGMGGRSVFRVQAGDPNLQVIIESLTQSEQMPIMAQAFIPEIATMGDKRILMIDGLPVPYALARIPNSIEGRGNMVRGAKGVGVPLTERDRCIAAEVGPVLKQKGLLFVGLDVIGEFLTEINVTSPTCIREIERAFQIDIAQDVVAAIAQSLSSS